MATRKRPAKPPKSKARRIRNSASKQSAPAAAAVNEPASRVASRVSKQATVVAMLRQPAGTSIAAIMAATGWQEHSIRGFFAAVVKKRLGLSLVSEKTYGGRLYRINETDLGSTD